MYAAHPLKYRARKRRSRRGWRRSISASFFEGLLRHPVLKKPKTVEAALAEVFAVILPVEATTPLLDAPPDIEASMVCVTLDVTDATTTTAPVMATSILLRAFISSKSPSPSRGGESGRSGALPAVVHGIDSHWRDPWPKFALRSVPHA